MNKMLNGKVVKMTEAEIAQQKIDSSYTPSYKELREYPSIGDQLDALWKGGEEAENMRSIIMAEKLRVPKPKN